MSKRLDPNGLSGAFARVDAKSALDFLVPVRPQPEPEEPVVQRDVSPSPPWTPASSPWSQAESWQGIVGRKLEALVGSVIRRLWQMGERGG